MTRRGWRRMASTAARAFGIASRSSGFSPSGCPAGFPGRGICGGMSGPVGLMSFIIQQGLMFRSVKLHKLLQRLEYVLEKIALKGGGSNKLHWHLRRADERSRNPRQLAAEKKIHREP